MDITIQERIFSFTSEYDISAPGASYYARKAYFSFNDKLQLQTVDGSILARINGYFSLFRRRHDFNIVNDGRVYRFWCEKFWKQVYVCEGNQESFRLFTHKGLKYSIFKGEHQIASFIKNRIIFGKGNRYEILMDSDADLVVILCIVLTMNSSEEGSDNGTSITIDLGSLGVEDRPFDYSWEPR